MPSAHPHRTPIVGGNWKMNTDAAGAHELARQVADFAMSHAEGAPEIVIFPPFVYLAGVGRILKERASRVRLGAQDVYFEANGAFTGEISTAMLKDVGCDFVLTGHSERRHVLGESDDIVNRKTLAALGAGLSCTLCIGEKLEERERCETDRVNERQLRAGLKGVTAEQMRRVVIAYEPVWAIGTGKTATASDAQAAHAHIRSLLKSMYGAEISTGTRIEYGGSVKASNAAELFAQPDIDGGLIGGASLKIEEFSAIVAAAGSPAGAAPARSGR